VKRAVAGADRLFLIGLIADTTQTADRALIAESAKAGMKRIVKISAGGDGTKGIGKVHRDQEEWIKQSGVKWTFLRPGMFMSNTLGWAATIKAQGSVFSPFGDGKMAMIAPRDIAAVAAEALTDPRHEGQIYELFGAALLTVAQQVEILSRVLSKQIKLVDITPEAAGERLRASGASAILVEGLTDLWTTVRRGQVALRNDEVARITGRPAQNFETFCREHQAVFAG
jgi:uncharacterized protein YbjT (DUF2867 family)